MHDKGIKFLSNAFDLESLKFLKSLGLEIAKVPSGEITNYPFLKDVALLFQKIILSTGMSTNDDISNAIKVLKSMVSTKNIIVLHCNTEYPTSMTDVNLLAMLDINKNVM